MSSAEPAPVAQVLRNRRDAIADHWYRAVAPTSFAPFGAEQVRQRLNDLTEQVIALLLAEPLDRDAARSIGAALASLHYLEPRALAGTQEALAQQLVSGLSTDQIAALYPRLTALLAELAAGFSDTVRETILAEQEQIRQALVAERRQAQEALRESEARYRAVSELTSDFAYSHRVELDGTLAPEWVTPAYSRITGFALGEVSINNWGSIMHPDDLPVALQLLQSNLANQAGVAEYRIFAKDGAIRWLRAYGRPVWDEAQGRVVRILGAVQDITERKQAEKKLYEAEARYRTLVEQIPAITYIGALDEASTTLYVSPQIETILGFSPAEYQANPDMWRERLHPDDRERILAEVARCHAAGVPLVSDYRMLTRDGRVVWFHDEAVLVRNVDGQPLFLQGVMLDITERKRIETTLQESELRYRSLVETSPDAIALVDLDFRRLLCNQQDAVLHGYESTEEMIGGNILDLVAPEDRPRARGYVSPGLKAGSIRNLELTLLKKDGTRFAAEISASTITNVDGQPQFFMTVLRDITERKRAEAALRQSEETARGLLNAITDSAFLMDVTGTVLSMNEATAKSLGKSTDELQGSCIYDSLAPDMAKGRRAQVDEVIHSGKPVRFEDERGGSWFDNSLYPILDAQGKVARIAIYARDITQRKQAEESQRENEERLKFVLEGSQLGFWDWNIGTGEVRRNERWAEMLGYTLQEIEFTVKQWTDLVHPDDRAAAWQSIQDHLESRTPVHEIEYRMLTKDGQYRWILDRARIVKRDPRGQPLRMSGTHTDITEQRQMRDLLVRHAQEMEALYNTSLEINSQPDVPILLQAIVQRAAGLVGTQMGGLYLIKPDGQTLELVVSYNLPGDYLGVTLHLGEGLAGCVAQTGKPMAIEDYLSWEGRPAAYANAPFHRVLGVPLRVRDRITGVINVNDDKKTGPFSEDEIRLVSLFADQAALAIENARLYQAEREQRELAETLCEVGATLTSTLQMDEILDRLLDTISRAVPNDGADIRLIEGDYTRMVRWRGYDKFGNRDMGDLVFRIAPVHDLQAMVKTGQPVFIPDTGADPDWIPYPGFDWLHSYACAPIRIRGAVIGFLDAVSATPGFFDPKHAERLRVFADQAAIALENARLFEEARKTAERLQLLSRRLVEVQEEERRHIARELHDEIGQTLTGLTLLLAMSARQAGDATRDTLSEAQALTHDLLTRVREMSLDLRPAMLDDLGLVPALLWHLERYTAQTQVRVILKHALPEQRFAPEIETVAYRVVQEALTNVARHAGVSEATVRLWTTQNTLVVQVQDQGTGLDPEAQLAEGRASGLSGMRERAALLGGQLTIESSPGAGTCLMVELPLHQLRDSIASLGTTRNRPRPAPEVS